MLPGAATSCGHFTPRVMRPRLTDRVRCTRAGATNLSPGPCSVLLLLDRRTGAALGRRWRHEPASPCRPVPVRLAADRLSHRAGGVPSFGPATDEAACASGLDDCSGHVAHLLSTKRLPGTRCRKLQSCNTACAVATRRSRRTRGAGT